MALRPITFLGRVFQIPGSYAAVRVKSDPTGMSPDLNTMVIIGPADNGWDSNDETLAQSFRIMDFSNFSEAKNVLGSGDLLDAIKVAFNPSKDTRFPGPSKIQAINVNPNVTASVILKDSAGADVTVKAVVPGPAANDLRIRVSMAGDLVEIGDSTQILKFSGMLAPDLRITYSGNATSSTAVYDGAYLTVTLTGQTDSSASFSIDVKSAKTLGDLANKISAQPGFYAQVLSSPENLTENLDHISTAFSGTMNLLSALWRQSVVIRDSGYAILSPPSVRKPLADMANFAYLSGGLTGTADSTAWINAIELAKNTSAFYVNVCTGTPGIVSTLADMVYSGNTPEGAMERFGGAGHPASDTFSAACEAAKTLNSKYMVYGADPVEVYQSDGLTTKIFDGWMLAIIHNAIAASGNVREAAHGKELNIISAPRIHSQTELKMAMSSGVLIVTKKPQSGAYQILMDLTTSRGSGLGDSKSQVVRLSLAMAKHLRETMYNEFFGETPTDPDAEGTNLDDILIRDFVEQIFEDDFITRFGWLTRNIYTGEPAYDKNFTIRRDGNAFYFIFPNGNMVTSIDFMFHLLNLGVVRGSSSGGSN